MSDGDSGSRITIANDGDDTGGHQEGDNGDKNSEEPTTTSMEKELLNLAQSTQSSVASNDISDDYVEVNSSDCMPGVLQLNSEREYCSDQDSLNTSDKPEHKECSTDSQGAGMSEIRDNDKVIPRTLLDENVVEDNRSNEESVKATAQPEGEDSTNTQTKRSNGLFKLRQLKQRDEEIKQQRNELKREKVELVVQVRERQAVLTQQCREKEDLKQKLHESTESLKIVQEQLSVMRNEVSSSVSEMADLKEENVKLMAKIDHLGKWKQKAISNIKEKDGIIIVHTTHLEKMKKEKKDIESSSASRITKLMEENERLAKKVVHIQRLKEETVTGMEDKDHEIQSYTRRLEKMKNLEKEAAKQIQTMEEQNESQKEKINNLIEENENMKQEISKSNEEAIMEKRRSGRRIDKLSNENAAYLVTVKELMEQVKGIKEENEKMKGECQRRKQRRNEAGHKLVAEVEHLQKITEYSSLIGASYNYFDRFCGEIINQMDELKAKRVDPKLNSYFLDLKTLASEELHNINKSRQQYEMSKTVLIPILGDYKVLLESVKEVIGPDAEHVEQPTIKTGETISNEEIELLRVQVQTFQTDFQEEREARERLAGENDQLKEELRKLKIQAIAREDGHEKKEKGNIGASQNSQNQVNLRNTHGQQMRESESAKVMAAKRNNQFKCPICNALFNSVENVTRHVQTCD